MREHLSNFCLTSSLTNSVTTKAYYRINTHLCSSAITHSTQQSLHTFTLQPLLTLQYSYYSTYRHSGVYVYCAFQLCPPPSPRNHFFPCNLRPRAGRDARGGMQGGGQSPPWEIFEVFNLKKWVLRELFASLWRVCKDRTHTVNDDYHLLKLK